MAPWTAELVGTALLLLIGNGVVANVLLPRTKGNNTGWIVITAGWGLAVYIGAFCSEKYSGAHLNPAVSIAMLVVGKLTFVETITYIVAQSVGALIGSILVYFFYREHFKLSDDRDAKLACFCTGANINNNPQSFFCELVATFALILPILLMIPPSVDLSSVVAAGSTAAEAKIGMGSLGLLPVALLVFGIGLGLGGTTGYAINPARDLIPRIAHAILPVPGKGSCQWGYAWVPVAGPIAGAILAAIAYKFLVGS